MGGNVPSNGRNGEGGAMICVAEVSLSVKERMSEGREGRERERDVNLEKKARLRSGRSYPLLVSCERSKCVAGLGGVWGDR